MRITQLLSTRLRRVTGLSWSRLRTEIKVLHSTTITQVDNDDTSFENRWNIPFKLKEPELDLKLLLHPEKREVIRKNVIDRKGVGDMDKVEELYEELTKTSDYDEKEKIRKHFLAAAREIPNISHPQSPIGEEDQAIIVEKIGIKREPTVEEGRLKTVVELAENLGHLRISNVSMTTGHTTYYFLDKLAQLEQALVRYTLDFLQEKGFELISVPDLLHPEIIESCGFKTTGDVAQVYRLDPLRHPDLCLAGTAEMSLAGFYANELLQDIQLPSKLAAVSRCYRAETSHTEAESGIYRVHQFTKVEMFGVTKNETGEEGNELLAELVEIEKTLFSQLGLHFRVLDMPTAELGAPAHRKFDIEAWMPGKQMWGEISSASNCTDYQSRRLNIKYQADADRVRHCTTVNGTACAVPRTIMALFETHQNKGGSISIPKVLQKYMDGLKFITKSESVPKTMWIKAAKLKKVAKPVIEKVKQEEAKQQDVKPQGDNKTQEDTKQQTEIKPQEGNKHQEDKKQQAEIKPQEDNKSQEDTKFQAISKQQIEKTHQEDNSKKENLKQQEEIQPKKSIKPQENAKLQEIKKKQEDIEPQESGRLPDENIREDNTKPKDGNSR